MPRFMWKDMEKRILWEDDSVIVLHKPGGLAVQSAKVGQMDLESLLRGYLHGGYVGLVHRLDQPVEGVMAVAKTRKAASELEGQLARGSFGKSYAALAFRPEEAGAKADGLCPPILPGEKHVLEDYLLRDGRTNLSRTVPKGTPGAKRARLSYELVSWVASQQDEGIPSRALFWVELETGRHHQIRVQLAHAGYPLVGDQKYGQGDFGSGSCPALCSAWLSFDHPVSGRPLAFGALPENPLFSDCLKQIKDHIDLKLRFVRRQQ